MKELYNLIKPEIYNELKKREINLLEEVKFLLKKEIKVRNVVSEKKLSEMLAISRQTLSSWRKKNKIPYYRINGRIRYNLDEVLALFRVDARWKKEK